MFSKAFALRRLRLAELHLPLDRPDAEGENAVKAFTDFLASNNMK